MGYICRCLLNNNVLSHNKHITCLFTNEILMMLLCLNALIFKG